MNFEVALAEIAHTKAHRAKEMVDVATVELSAANKTLQRAIPKGNVGEIKAAHTRTQKAEEAVVEAGHELDVIEVLLDSASGQGGGKDNDDGAMTRSS